MTEIEPCVITWFKNGKYHMAQRKFYTEEDITRYYSRNRNRVAVLMIIIPVSRLKECHPDVLRDLKLSHLITDELKRKWELIDKGSEQTCLPTK